MCDDFYTSFRYFQFSITDLVKSVYHRYNGTHYNNPTKYFIVKSLAKFSEVRS